MPVLDNSMHIMIFYWLVHYLYENIIKYNYKHKQTIIVRIKWTFLFSEIYLIILFSY